MVKRNLSWQICTLAIYQNDLLYLDENVSASFERDIKDPGKRNPAMEHFSVISNLFWASSGIIFGGHIALVSAVIISACRGTYVGVFPVHWPIKVTHGKLSIFWGNIKVEAYHLRKYLFVSKTRWNLVLGIPVISNLYSLLLRKRNTEWWQYIRVLLLTHNRRTRRITRRISKSPV